MGIVKCHIAIDKKYLDLASKMCDTYDVDMEIDQYIVCNPFSKKRAYIIKTRKDNITIDEQNGYDLDWNFDMLGRRLKFVFS